MGASGIGSRNVRVVAASSFLTGTYSNLLQVVLQPFVVFLTGSVVALGVLQTLATRLGGVVGSLATWIGGAFADRWGRKPVLLLASAFNMTSLSLFLASALLRAPLFLVPAFMFLGLGLMSAPASQSTVAESVTVPGRAMAYSKVLFFLVLPAAFVAFLGGYVADVLGYPTVFAASLTLEAMNFGLFALVLRETLPERDRSPLAPCHLLRLPDPRLRGLLLVATVDAFAWTISSMIIYGMAVLEFGLTSTDIGVIVGVWALVFAATTLPVGRIVERFGSRGMLLLSEALGVPVMVGWILSRETWQFATVSVFNGLTASTWVPAWNTLLANSVEDRTRGRVTGQVTAVRGFLSFPAPLLGSLLYEAFGYPAPMLASLVGILVAMLLVLRFVGGSLPAETR